MPVQGSLGAFAQKLGRLPASVEREVSQAMYRAGQFIQTEAQISITEGSVSGKNHQPSKPGDPPHNDTSTLRNGIQAVQVAPLKVEIEATAPYSAHLEFGTSKMAARPYMGPAAHRAKPAVVDHLTKAVQRAVRRGMKG